MKEQLLKELEYHLTPHGLGEHKPDSIMTYGVICNHDDAFMCEHRAAWVIQKVKELNEPKDA